MRKIALASTLALALVAPAGATAADPPNRADFKNAAKYCKALRTASGEQNFRAMFGGGNNAYGKCVSKAARDEAAEREAARKNAAKQCKAERAMSDEEFKASHGGKTFREFYGTNASGNNAYGKCVSQKAKENKQAADAEDQDRVNAAEQCKDERAQSDEEFKASHGGKTFAQYYATNAGNKNAFGKCVSQKAKAQNDAEGTTGS